MTSRVDQQRPPPWLRKEVIGGCTLYLGDCIDVLPHIEETSCCITDPPYGETNLAWDLRVAGWHALLKCRSLWCFGSMRFFLEEPFPEWKHAQEIVWEKQNGSGLHADRFKRVHELAVHFYKGEWLSLYKQPVYTPDATARTVRKKAKPAHHIGATGPTVYVSEDGGPRMMRSVIYARNCHGHAYHPTQKPIYVIRPLVEYSCPPDGVVLDPFMGSGTTGIACALLKRSFIGIEKNEDYFRIACDRIRQVYGMPSELESGRPMFI